MTKFYLNGKLIKETLEDIDGEWIKKSLDRKYKSMRVDDLKWLILGVKDRWKRENVRHERI